MARKAIVHVEDTTNLLEFARYLVSSGWILLSANKTEELLKKEKLAVTREPALIDNNLYFNETSQLIKTVQETRDFDSEDIMDSESNGIQLVCVNFIPKYRTVNTIEDLSSVLNPENHYPTDLLRNSIVNYSNVLILTDPEDYKEATIQLRVGKIKPEFRAYLAAKALNLISAYDAAISNSVLKSQFFDSKFSKYNVVPFKKFMDLNSGENSQQKAAIYSKISKDEEDYSLSKIQGKELNYNSCSDLSYAWEQISYLFTYMKNQMTVKSINCDGYEFTTQFTPVVGTVFTVAVKNNSILGASLSPNVLDSFIQTYTYDTDNIKGVTLACSSVINEDAAKEMVKGDFDSIIAPGFTTEARQFFTTNRNIRLISSARIALPEMEAKVLIGGLLTETKESILFEKWHVRTKNRPSQYKTDEMAFGMMIVMHSRSYSAVLIKQNAITGIAQSCSSSLKAIKNVLTEAQESIGRHPASDSEEIDNILGDILVSDFPIPFCDETRELIDKGVTAIIQPGGTADDDEFIKYCDERGIVMVFTGMSHLSY